MARSRAGRYLSFTGECNIVHVPHGANIDAWCARHGEYVVRCERCERLFHTKRPHTKYCSGACSQKAYRERKRLAEIVSIEELSDLGWKLEDLF